MTLAASGWSENTQTVTATGVTANNNVIVAPDAASLSAYGAAQVAAETQTTNAITFVCAKVPSGDLIVNVMIVG